MAYPRKIRNAARRLWLMGYSDEKVCLELAKLYPDQKTPKRHPTIISWRKAEEWEKDLPKIEQKLNENRTEEIVDALRQEELEDLKVLQLAITHTRSQLSRRDSSGKPIPVSLKEINLAASALDKLMRRKRINRFGFDTINKVDLDNADVGGMAGTPENTDSDV